MRGDADDGALAGRGLVFDGVVADEDVRQRGGAAEEGDHQREEVELFPEGVAADAGERGAAAGREDVFAQSGFFVINGFRLPVVLNYLFRSPENDRALLKRAEI